MTRITIVFQSERGHPLTTIQTHRNATKSYLNHVTQLRKRGFTRSVVSGHIPAGPAENRGCAESLLTGQIAGNGTGKLFGGSVAHPRILDLSAVEGV